VGKAQLDKVRVAFLADLEQAGGDAEAVEKVRIKYAGRRSGLLLDLTAALRELPKEEKRDYGRALNELKTLINTKLAEVKVQAHAAAVATGPSSVDVTLPGTPVPRGAQHPVHIVRRRIEEIFLRMGYDVEAGPEAEDDWHNFEALNIPPDHPARDDQDTFYLPGGYLLRTHTSPVQARVMESRRPPIRIRVASTAATPTSVTHRCSTRSKGCWWTRASPSATSRQRSRLFSTLSSPTMSRSGCGPATFRSPSRRRR